MSFESFTQVVADECYSNTKNAAYRIIHDQGFTCYSISTAVLQMMRAIFEDSHEVFPLSTLLDNYHGYSNVCLSVPCILGRGGILQQIEVPLDDKEQAMLAHSVEVLNGYLEK